MYSWGVHTRGLHSTSYSFPHQSPPTEFLTIMYALAHTPTHTTHSHRDSDHSHLKHRVLYKIKHM